MFCFESHTFNLTSTCLFSYLRLLHRHIRNKKQWIKYYWVVHHCSKSISLFQTVIWLVKLVWEKIFLMHEISENNVCNGTPFSILLLLASFHDQRTLSDKSMWRNCLVDQVSSRWRDGKGNSCFDFTFLSFKGLIEKLIIKFENGEWRTMAEVWNQCSSWDSSIKLLKKYNSVIHSMCWGK